MDRRLCTPPANSSSSDRRHCDEPNQQDTAQTSAPSATSPTLPEVQEDDAVESLELCEADDEGNFGTTDGGYMENVKFHYQVQTAIGLSAHALRTEVIRDIEIALSALLVPDLFQGDQCHVNHRKRRLARNSDRIFEDEQSARLATDTGLIGLRPYPPDKIAPGIKGVTCQTAFVGNAERCFLVEGAYQLHGHADISHMVPFALDLTRLLMNYGLLNDVHPQLVDVRYIADVRFDGYTRQGTNGTDFLRNNSRSDDDPTAESATEVGSGRIWPWAIFGCGVLALLGVAALTWRDCRKRRQSFSGSNGPPSLSSDDLLQREVRYRGAYPVPTGDEILSVQADPLCLSSNSAVSEEERSHYFTHDDEESFERRRHLV